MDHILIATIATVGLAILFDFTNGFHDAANSTSTVIATRSLSPRKAVALAALFNFLPAFVVGTAVANTITRTINLGDLPAVGADVVPIGVRLTLAALIGATLWNFFTWRRGLPSSSSHALIGGLVGAGLAAGGMAAVNWSLMRDIAIAIVASPLVALVIAVAAVLLIRLVQRLLHLDEDHVVFQIGQIASSCWVSWGHGANDAQKTMGVIAGTLFSAGYLSTTDPTKITPPVWVIFAAQIAIAVGTMYGGWSIIETMGLKITRITRASGLGANIGAIVAINGATSLGAPISTTQAVSASVVGSGVGARRLVHWTVMRDMVIAWALTIPAAAVVAFGVFQLTVLPSPLAPIATGGAIVALVAYAAHLARSARTREDVTGEIPSAENLHERDAPEAIVVGD